MIELSDGALSLAEAAQLVPPFRPGTKTHVNTLFRWAKHGVRGVRLDTAKLGGRTVTSRAALQEFMDRLSTGRSSEAPSAAHAAAQPPAPKTPAGRRRSAERADKELAAAGF